MITTLVPARSRVVLLALTLGAVLLGALRPSVAPVAGQNAPNATPLPTSQSSPRGNTSSCQGTTLSTVITPTLRTCEEAEIQLQAEAICPVCPAGVNLIVVMQEFAHEPLWMQAEAQAVVDRLERFNERNPDSTVRVAVIHYDSRGARTAQALTDNLRTAKGAMRFGTGTNNCLAPVCFCYPYLGNLRTVPALITRMLRDVRKDSNLGDDDKTCDFVLLFNESTLGSCAGFSLEENALNAIGAGRDIERNVDALFVGCPSTAISDCEGTVRMLSNKRYFAQPPFRGALPGAFDGELDRLHEPNLLRNITIKQQLPPELSYVANSAAPTPSVVDVTEAGTSLQWVWDKLGVDGPHDVRYRIAPNATGRYTVTGVTDILDGNGKDRQVVIPPASVDVYEPCVTPTEPPPTETPTVPPTATFTPSATPTSTLTPTSTATPTPRPKPVYLPISLNERCDPERRAADIVLVIDASTSMLETTGGGRTKLAAAVAAAQSFLDQLHMATGADRAAIVAFNAQAHLLQPLTQNRAALDAALNGIVPATLTCIPCAIETGEAALSSGGAPGRSRTMILLTDGRSNPRPVSEAVASAQRAKADGIVIYTVGIGNDLDVDALRDIASGADHSFLSPDAADLEQIYAAIADLLPCPLFWPQAP
jgi:Mg-chelatase subunit ChlD